MIEKLIDLSEAYKHALNDFRKKVFATCEKETSPCMSANKS